MGKYIDAEKLIAEIERFSATEYGGITLEDDVANGALDYVIEEIIPSLQQEQPEMDLDEEIDRFLKSEESTTYENAGSYKVAVKDPKKIARHFYELGLNARVVQPDYTYNSKEFLEKKIEELHKEVAVLKKEQSQILDEVDLEKELEKWRHDHFKGKRDGDYNGEYLERESQLELACYFWNKGLNARKL